LFTLSIHAIANVTAYSILSQINLLAKPKSGAPQLSIWMLLAIKIIQRVCKAISGDFVVSARNCIASTLGYIVMQIMKLKGLLG